MHHNRHTTGYSLVEVMVAVAILMLSIVGPMTIAAKSIQSAQFVRQQDTAFFLAQEGIGIMNAIRNDDELKAVAAKNTDAWGWVTNASLAPCFAATGCDIDARDNSFTDNVVNCSSAATACQLKFDEKRNRAVYQHVSGTATPYTRIITLVHNGDEVAVTSTVTWTSALLRSDQSVSMQTSLFNLYK